MGLKSATNTANTSPNENKPKVETAMGDNQSSTNGTPKKKRTSWSKKKKRLTEQPETNPEKSESAPTENNNLGQDTGKGGEEKPNIRSSQRTKNGRRRSEAPRYRNGESWRSRKEETPQIETPKTATDLGPHSENDNTVAAMNLKEADSAAPVLQALPPPASETPHPTIEAPAPTIEAPLGSIETPPITIEWEAEIPETASTKSNECLGPETARDDVAHGQNFKTLVSTITSSLIKSYLAKEKGQLKEERSAIQRAWQATSQLIRHLKDVGFPDVPLDQSWDRRAWMQTLEPDWICHINYTDTTQLRKLRSALKYIQEGISKKDRRTREVANGDTTTTLAAVAANTPSHPKASTTIATATSQHQGLVPSSKHEKTAFLAVMEILQKGPKQPSPDDGVSSAAFELEDISSSVVHQPRHENQRPERPAKIAALQGFDSLYKASSENTGTVSAATVSFNNPYYVQTPSTYGKTQFDGNGSSQYYGSPAPVATFIETEQLCYQTPERTLHAPPIRFQATYPNEGNVQDGRIDAFPGSGITAFAGHTEPATPLSAHLRGYRDLSMPDDAERKHFMGNRPSSTSVSGNLHHLRDTHLHNQAIAGVYAIRQKHNSLSHHDSPITKSGWKTTFDHTQGALNGSQHHPAPMPQNNMASHENRHLPPQTFSASMLQDELKRILEKFNDAQRQEDIHGKVQHLTEVQSVLTRAIKDHQASSQFSPVAKDNQPTRDWAFDDSQTPEELFTRIDFSNVGDLKHMRASVCNGIAEYRRWMVKTGIVRPVYNKLHN